MGHPVCQYAEVIIGSGVVVGVGNGVWGLFWDVEGVLGRGSTSCLAGEREGLVVIRK